MFNPIKLTNLRNSEFVQFFQHIDKLAIKYDPKALNIEAAYNPLKKNIDIITVLYKQKTGSDLSEEMAALDKRRDDALNGMVAVTRGFKYSHDEKVSQAATDLLESIDFYGDNIARMNYPAETSTVTDLINRWRTETKLVKAVKTIKQEGWVTELDEANKAFDSLFLSRVEESAENPEIKFRDVRIDIGEQYFTLLKHIEAYAIVNGMESYKPLVDRINALIDEYDRMLDMRKAKSNANNEELASENTSDIE